MTKQIITQKRLKELLHYDPETGIFKWKIRPANCIQIGDIAGTLNMYGYISILFKRKHYQAHRLAFLYMTGKIPEEVDHINHTRNDNRWRNLDESSRKANAKNKGIGKNNTSGVVGVYFNKNAGKWKATIKVNGKGVHLGYFEGIEDARKAKKEAEIKHGFHPNHGI